MTELLLNTRKKVKKNLDKERYEHTKGVMYTAGALAMAHGADLESAMLAGVLHDCAKCIPNDEKIRLCKDARIRLSKVELRNPSLIHAKLGAYLAATEYGVAAPEICHAIAVHTTGAPNMNTLDKIIYIADYIEPNRDRAPDLEAVRALAFKDLDECLIRILKDSLDYLSGSSREIDPMTQKTYDFYCANDLKPATKG